MKRFALSSVAEDWASSTRGTRRSAQLTVSVTAAIRRLASPVASDLDLDNASTSRRKAKLWAAFSKLVYCASLGDKYVAIVGHLAHLVRHSFEEWSMADAREALSTLGEEFTQRLSNSVESIKLEIQAAKNIGGSGAAPTVAQLLGVATTPGLDGSSFFTSAHVVYDLGPASYFETEVVDDFVQTSQATDEAPSP